MRIKIANAVGDFTLMGAGHDLFRGSLSMEPNIFV
jgi:hypothetical protein